MALTNFGAIFENNMPSPLEVHDYFQSTKARSDAMAARDKMAKLKELEETEKAYTDAVKPLAQFKADTGYSDPNPNLVLNKRAEDLQKEAAQMYKSGKSPVEVSQFIQNSVRDLDRQHSWYKDARESLEKQLSTLKPADGIDVNQLRELAITDLLYVDDGKGGKKLRSGQELEDVNGLLPKVMRKYADAIPIKDRSGMYKVDQTSFGEDFKKVRTADGRIVYGAATGNYNPLYQEVKQGSDYKVSVHTKSVPAEKNGEVITDRQGNPIKVLPTEAYLDYISVPGRMVEVEKGVKKRLQEEQKKQEFEAQKEAGDQLSAMYGSKWREMPAGKRFSLQRQMQEKILKSYQPPDEELIRQSVAYEQADKNIQKGDIKVNEIRDPSIKVVNTSSKADSNKEVTIDDVYQSMVDTIGDKGFSSLDELDSQAISVVMKAMKNFKKTSPLGPQDYSADELTIKNEGGKLAVYTTKDGKRRMYLTKAGVNKQVNPKDKGTTQAILNNGGSKNKPKGPKQTNPNADELRSKYNY